jgi:catechol 2,3-dioxygenase-like lactoylglutathione lyase family enzyme
MGADASRGHDGSPSLAPYRGEFRYVFYARRGRYDQTVAFYEQTLGFPIVGGFGGPKPPRGAYLGASTGVIEVLDETTGGGEDSELKALVLEAGQPYEAPRGGFLLIEVEDVDQLARQILERGVTLHQEVRDWEWRFRDFKVQDPSGNLLCIFSRRPGWEVYHQA